MAKHLLTDTKVRNLKPKVTPYRKPDGDNLYVYVAPSGVKSWQFRYRLEGKPQTLTLGKYPAMSLADARKAAEKARRGAEEGQHLTVTKRIEKRKRATDAANTFKAVAALWVRREARRRKWSPDYQDEVERSLENHLSPLNGIPLSQITAKVVAPVINAIEHKAPLMVEKVRPRLVAILDYAAEQGIIVGNPLPRGQRGKKAERRHYPAVTDLSGVGDILRRARAADPCKGIRRAHLLLAFTAMRVSEVVGATWGEFALDGTLVPVGSGHAMKVDSNAGDWTIPRERMKRKDAGRGPHVVPLPPALLAELREWKKADGDDAIFICPAPRDPSKPITPEGVEKFYRDALQLAGKHSPHSWRSAFSTIARDAGKDGDSVEAQLDHVVGNKVASAYDRAKRLALRRELMTWYEEMLLASRDGAEVIPIRQTI